MFASFFRWIFIRNIKVLYYDKFDVSEGIDFNKTSALRERKICHHWYFLNYSFKFQTNACNRFHDLLMMSIKFSNIAILNIKVSDYCCIISLISKNEAINLMQNVENCKFEKKKINKIFWKHIKKWKKYKIWWYWNPRTKI